MAGTVSGLLFADSDDLPQIRRSTTTRRARSGRVTSLDGDVIGEFATQRRIVIGYDDIPVSLRQAIVAAEDAGFDSHVGLSIPRIVITATRDIVYGAARGREHADAAARPQPVLRRWTRRGTQDQGSDSHDPDREALHEARDLTLDRDQMYLATAPTAWNRPPALYFNKRACDLTLEESAMIAASSSCRSVRVRSSIFNARHAGGITCCSGWRRSGTSLRRRPMRRRRSRSSSKRTARAQPVAGPYFVEEVRKYLERTYGAKKLYEQGLTVETSLDSCCRRPQTPPIDAGLRRARQATRVPRAEAQHRRRGPLPRSDSR